MEKNISTGIINSINKRPGCFVYKRLSSGSTSTNGYPDITGVIYINLNGLSIGIHTEIETKIPGKTPDDLQYSKLHDFRLLNCIAFWTDSKKDAMIKIDMWLSVFHGDLKHPGFGDLEGEKTYILEDL